MAIIIFFIVYSAVFYFTAIDKYEDFYIDQKYREQAIAADSGANSMTIFLGHAKNSLLLLSRSSSIINMDSQIQDNFDKFAEEWAESPITAVARFDKEGIIQYYATSTEGITPELIVNYSIADTDFYEWATNASEGDILLSKPMVPKLKIADPQFILPLSTPIYKNGEFDGVVGIAISLPKLASTFLDPMKVSPGSRAYLIHSDSTIIATISGYEGLVGLNYFSFLNEKPYPGSEEAIVSMTNALKDEKSGKMDVILFSPPQKDFVRFLIAYSPVIFDNQHWTIGLAVPYDDIDSGLLPFKRGGIIFIALFIVIIIALSFIGTLLTKIIKILKTLPSKK